MRDILLIHLGQNGFIDIGRYFSLSGYGAPLRMADTLADRQHSGNDPRLMSLRKIMLNFWNYNICNLF